jgi:hypothetical protein
VRQRLSVLPPLQRDLECVFVQPDDFTRWGERVGDQHFAAEANLEVLGRKPKRVDD